MQRISPSPYTHFPFGWHLVGNLIPVLLLPVFTEAKTDCKLIIKYLICCDALLLPSPYQTEDQGAGIEICSGTPPKQVPSIMDHTNFPQAHPPMKNHVHDKGEHP